MYVVTATYFAGSVNVFVFDLLKDAEIAAANLRFHGADVTVIQAEAFTINADSRFVVEAYDVRRPVYIGRPSKWGNPFVISNSDDDGPGGRLDVIKEYEEWLYNQPELMNALSELKGKVLGCWCAPKPCHGDVLVELANG